MTAVIYLITGSALFALGLYGMFFSRHLLRKIIAANIGASGVFLVLVTGSGSPADPVAQAMVLTGIVISVSLTALGLVLVRRLFAETGQCELPEDER